MPLTLKGHHLLNGANMKVTVFPLVLLGLIRYRQGQRCGAVLPPDGVTYYDIPGEYHVQGYRYAYVNDHAVLVDPRTRQIVEIVD
jgi:hypothetical protein